MPILTKPSAEARVSLLYITGGALLDVWSIIWFIYMRNHAPSGSLPYYLCAGIFLSGLTLLIIGLALGRIGRAARRAELPPPEVTAPVTRAEQVAAANPPVVAGIPPTAIVPETRPAPVNHVPAEVRR
jgi:hypothetical protein